ncbi:intradiol ring-cleavage dioxygenase [Dyadobacter chenwenxiniae]|uniref:Intradiol ring-cleavage dioxygenase n=1 Tax=Dyadobacter chenwenxiniae TaxID=2906456 RepID=A0A9X1PSJ5_9BACT|nr:intradiol ring-cleavage dioxygenase [Dyadobacter chenwenxiniae]MCF0065705.1 intradiol ring-cleavage dioxygenase [Dyadobacter chenwenxiniae]UON82052.1 intradiol ring-cleavage dioxygenase [Dyadobacter chenwenxiniae]
MERKEFLKRGFSALGFAAIMPMISCSGNTVDTMETGTETTSGTTTGSASGTCTVTASETAGPFPTKTPGSLVTNDITSDREGTKLSIKITIQNLNKSCEGLPDALVDIWHCDAGGNYSEYGGSGMQSTNYTHVHFLRGRQTTDANGLVTFTSIYPGWYSGRAPHIHVHVYNASGKSLLVTQIAFPEAISKVVYAQGVYASHGQADTSNARDNVFSDGTSTEMPTVTGSVSAGYELTHAIIVSA